MLSSWITTGYIAFQNNHNPSTEDPLALFDKIYDKPWTRLGPYLVGMLVGWVLFKTNCQIKMSKVKKNGRWMIWRFHYTFLVGRCCWMADIICSFVIFSLWTLRNELECTHWSCLQLFESYSLGFGTCLDSCCLYNWIWR